jgi:membrane-associated protease RseP (regulator of RpoE activity)
VGDEPVGGDEERPTRDQRARRGGGEGCVELVERAEVGPRQVREPRLVSHLVYAPLAAAGLERRGEGWFVAAILDQAAAAAGLLPGDEILSAGGAPFAPIESLCGKEARAPSAGSSNGGDRNGGGGAADR